MGSGATVVWLASATEEPGNLRKGSYSAFLSSLVSKLVVFGRRCRVTSESNRIVDDSSIAEVEEALCSPKRN